MNIEYIKDCFQEAHLLISTKAKVMVPNPKQRFQKGDFVRVKREGRFFDRLAVVEHSYEDAYGQSNYNKDSYELQFLDGGFCGWFSSVELRRVKIRKMK